MKKQKLLKIISLALVIAALAAAVIPLHIHAQECDHEFGAWLPLFIPFFMRENAKNATPFSRDIMNMANPYG